MDALKILDRPEGINWDYDGEADVLYLSIGDPKPATGIDIGDGVLVRYELRHHEVVGLTVIGLRCLGQDF